jgi:membrane associated rhomboid family serine protease
LVKLRRFRWLFILLILIWATEVVNLLTGHILNEWFGLRPRSIGGLDGILFMPLLHGSISHVANNTFPLLILGCLLTATAEKLLILASIFIVVFGGFCVWLFGSNAIHVGSSGLIFGWFGFLLARGLIEKRAIPLLVAVGVALFYGTMIWGVLPGQTGISWEAHISGATAGTIAAIFSRNST